MSLIVVLYGLVWSFIAFVGLICHFMVFYGRISYFLAVIDPNSFGLVSVYIEIVFLLFHNDLKYFTIVWLKNRRRIKRFIKAKSFFGLALLEVLKKRKQVMDVFAEESSSRKKISSTWAICGFLAASSILQSATPI